MSRIGPGLALLVLLLSTACGGPATDDEPAVAPAVPPPPAAPPAEPAAREHGEVPRPDLSPLKPEVRQQVEQELAELEALLEAPGAEPGELADRFGRLGRIYHAYGLFGPAESAYGSAAGLAPSDSRWPYLQAVVAGKRGDQETAMAQLERARELDPENLPTILRLADLHLLAGDTETAEALFRTARQAEPDSAAAAHGLGQAALSRGDHEAAVRYLRRALELQPEADSIHSQLGLAYSRLGDRAAAERHMAQRGEQPVTFPDPEVDGLQDLMRGVGIHIERGLQAFGANRQEEAIAEYGAALELEPENPIALRSYALALATAERWDEALAGYERMLAVYPEHQLARIEYATVLLQQGRVADAIASFDRAIANDPDFKVAHFNRAAAYARQGEWQKAVDGFREVLRIDRDDVEARYYLGMALDELGRTEEAVTPLRSAVDAAPQHLLARQRLGSVLDRLGRVDEALEQFQAVLGLDVPDQEKALALYHIGRLFDLEGRSDEALGSFQRAVELFPELWQARFAVANWYSRHARHAEATAIYSRLAAAVPANILFRQREAESLMREGRFADARRRLEQGLADHPRSYELASVLARLLATAPDPSLRDGERALQLSQELLAAHRSIEQAETVAMALAELGRFDEAAAFQRRILGWAESEGDADAMPRLRRNLARYESRQPARQVPG